MSQKYLFPDQEKLDKAKDAKAVHTAKIRQSLERVKTYAKFLQNYCTMSLDIEERTADRDSMRELTDLAESQAKAALDDVKLVSDNFNDRKECEEIIARLTRLKNAPTLSEAI